MKIKEGFQGQRAIVLPESIVSSMQTDSRTAVLYVTDIGYYPCAAHHYRERPEGIAQYILLFCVKGEGWFEVNGARRRVQENQVVVLPADTPHTYAADQKDPWSIYWIHFGGQSASLFFESESRYPKDITPEDDTRVKERHQLFEAIYTTLQLGYGWEYLHYASICLHHYLGSFLYLSLFRQARPTDEYQDPVRQAIHYMRDHQDQKLPVGNLADHLKLSVSYFSARFRQSTGYSPIAYQNALKIQEACRYLDFTDLKINQICFKLGFDDPYYFSRLFSKNMGLSPSAYRSRKKG